MILRFFFDAIVIIVGQSWLEFQFNLRQVDLVVSGVNSIKVLYFSTVVEGCRLILKISLGRRN